MEVDATASDAWEAVLALGYTARDGRTLPTTRSHRGPLRVQKHFEPEPGVCHHLIVHPPAGMASGDYVMLTIDVATGAHAQLATPGATPWYRSLGATARQTVHARVDGVLELLPREHLLFDEARAAIDTRFELGAGAKLIAWDILAFGRPHGERPFVNGTLSTALEITRDGELLFADRLRLDAADRLRASPLGLHDAHAMGTLVAVGADLSALLPALRELRTIVRFGVSQLPSVLVARALGPSAESVRGWLEQVWTIVRQALLGRPALPLRIWRT